MPGNSLYEPEPEPARNPVNPWLVAFAVTVATFMEVLSTTVVTVALPQIARSLSTSVEEASSSLTIYLLANGLILPVSGWLSIRFGRRFIIILAILVFTTASLFCGLVWTLPALVLWRTIQGASGGLLQPISQAVLLEAFPPKQRGAALAVFGLSVIIAAVLAPILGGWITDHYGWRWIFYINIPVGVVSVLMTRLYVFDPPYIRAARGIAFRDWGFGLLIVGFAALQVLFESGEPEGWFGSNRIQVLAAISAVALTAFIIREMRSRAPAIDIRIFRDRTFAAGVLLISVAGFVVYAGLFVLPVFLQLQLGYSAASAGVAMAARGWGSLLSMPVVGVLTGRVGSRKLLAGGFLATAASQYALSYLNVGSSQGAIFWPLAVQGAGFSFIFVSLATATTRHLRNEEIGNASGIYNLMRNVGGSVGIACAAAFFFRRQQLYTRVLGAREGVNHPQAVAGLGLASHYPQPVLLLHHSYSALWQTVQRQAGIWAFRDVFVRLAILLVLVLPLLLLMDLPARVERKEPPEQADGDTGEAGDALLAR